jgi:hypothetical protein
MTMKDMEFVPLQPPQGLAAVLNGDVDAAWFWDPFTSQAMEKGAIRIIINKELGAPDPFGIAVTTKFLADTRNVEGLGRMLRAFDEGQRRYAKDAEPTLAAITKIAGIERALSLQIIKGVDWSTVQSQVDPNGPFSLADPSNHPGAAAILKDGGNQWGAMIQARQHHSFWTTGRRSRRQMRGMNAPDRPGCARSTQADRKRRAHPCAGGVRPARGRARVASSFQRLRQDHAAQPDRGLREAERCKGADYAGKPVGGLVERSVVFQQPALFGG